MAEVEVKKGEKNEKKEVERREESRGLARRGWEPFGPSLMPFDLFGSNPFSLMRRLTDEMDRAFSRFFAGEEGELWAPAIEVLEKDGHLQVRAELPGLKPEDVKVEVTDDSLIIQGERKFEQEERRGGFYRSERRYGKFYREIPLPEGAKADEAKATFRDGVLEVKLPLPESQANRRTIPIET
jgi:HSP20 family protein